MKRSVHLPLIPPGKVASLGKYLGSIESEAPFIVLLPGQRQALGGALFPDCDQVVRSAASGMISEPELFADIDEDGHDLMNDYRTGAALDLFIARQETLLSAARDTRVALQARSLQRALSVLDQVRHDEDTVRERIDRQQKDPSPEQRLLTWRRRVVLLEAYGLVSAYYASLQAKKAGRKAARKAAQAGTAPAEPTARSAHAEPTAKSAPAAHAIGSIHAAHAAPAAHAAHKAPVSAKQHKARQQTRDGCWLETLEAFEDKVRAAAAQAPPKNLVAAPLAADPGPQAPPFAYSTAGLRRMAVLEGDRLAVAPARRRAASTPFRQAVDPVLDRYLAASRPDADEKAPAGRARQDK